MKKHVLIILAVVMALSCLALASCGGSKDSGSAPSADSKYVGVWNATQGEFKGEVVPIDEVLDGGVYILDLKADGTATVTTETDTVDEGTWTEKSNGVHVKAGDTDTDFIADGDNLTITFMRFTITFEKE